MTMSENSSKRSYSSVIPHAPAVYTALSHDYQYSVQLDQKVKHSCFQSPVCPSAFDQPSAIEFQTQPLRMVCSIIICYV